MAQCFSDRKNVKIPNFSTYKKSFLYTPCNCPLVDCSFTATEQPSPLRRYKTTRRIRSLSKPKCSRVKFYQRPVSQYGRTIQTIQTYREPYASTRIQQLANPKVRKLIAAREDYKRFLNRCWYDRFSKRIKRSMYTVYSRLANVQLSPPRPKTPSFTPEQWKNHQQWLAVNAQPKTAKPVPMKPRRRVPYAQLIARILSLSTPRWENKKYTGPAKLQPVKPAALKATASQRLQNLCIPYERNCREKGPIKEEKGLPENVLKAVASERVVELSKPKVYRNVRNEYRENPFSVVPNALKAKASDRILELAIPKKVKKH
ncbi:uncharacterized protein LOC129771089 [Toxorhynchites rutilus septentrionalis]|uniref:uncharacterized protein LOC129771089 n=1 Tax=Toxorhynchites rutilus septentrionalis TaxID=329112 RepID=UPI00247AD701|nr:uncharacterized protein LOC129771089 [Toxorhynchites rutilus septentrionalis]